MKKLQEMCLHRTFQLRVCLEPFVGALPTPLFITPECLLWVLICKATAFKATVQLSKPINYHSTGDRFYFLKMTEPQWSLPSDMLFLEIEFHVPPTRYVVLVWGRRKWEILIPCPWMWEALCLLRLSPNGCYNFCLTLLEPQLWGPFPLTVRKLGHHQGEPAVRSGPWTNIRHQTCLGVSRSQTPSLFSWNPGDMEQKEIIPMCPFPVPSPQNPMLLSQNNFMSGRELE